MAAKTILIVDDDLPLARLLDIGLTEAGYTTNIAKDGAAAFVELEITPPDLILVDVFMPVLDGITFYHLVRANPATCDTPIIIMSATANRDQAIPVAVASFLAKPFEIDVLLGLVESLIGPATADARVRE